MIFLQDNLKINKQLLFVFAKKFILVVKWLSIALTVFFTTAKSAHFSPMAQIPLRTVFKALVT